MCQHHCVRKPCRCRASGSWATNLGGSEDVLDGDGNLGANAITLDQADGVAALKIGISYMAYREDASSTPRLSDFHMPSQRFAANWSMRSPNRIAAYLRILLSVELGDTVLRVEPLVLECVDVS